MLREIPKHKGTDKLQADLKQKISKAKKEAASAKSSRKAHSVKFPRQGAGRAVILGGPNSGKSSLLAAVTRAKPEIGDYPFTTHEPEVGMMPWEDVFVQLIDTPPITSDYLESYMQGLIRGADLAVLMVDLGNDDGIEQGQDVVRRLDSTKTRLGRQSCLDEEDIGRSYTQTLLAANKRDVPDFLERLDLFRELCPLEFDEYLVSCHTSEGIKELCDAIYESLDVVRVYTKSPHEKTPDFANPFTIRRGHTLLEIAEQIHRDFADNLKFARVWGSNVHDGTHVKGDYVPHDRDVVELHV
jgi:ribosome-interacting GTPase 1